MFFPMLSFSDDRTFVMDQLYKSVEVNIFNVAERSFDSGFTKDKKGFSITGQYLLGKKVFLTSSMASYRVELEFKPKPHSNISGDVINRGIDVKTGVGYRYRYMTYFFGRKAKEVELTIEGSGIFKQPYQSATYASEYEEITQSRFGYEYIAKFKRSVVGGDGAGKVKIKALLEVGVGGLFMNDSLGQLIVISSARFPTRIIDNLFIAANFRHNGDDISLDFGLLYAF